MSFVKSAGTRTPFFGEGSLAVIFGIPEIFVLRQQQYPNKLKLCLLLYPIDSKRLGNKKINFECSENFPKATAMNPVVILGNPEIGVHLFWSNYTCFKFGWDRVSGCRNMNFDEWVRLTTVILGGRFRGHIFKYRVLVLLRSCSWRQGVSTANSDFSYYNNEVYFFINLGSNTRRT